MPTGSDKITAKPNNSIQPQHSNNNDNLITTATTTTATTTINQENETIETIGTNGATNGSNESNCGIKLPTGTYDPTPYIQRARVTRPAPPKPSCNPMQFVQIKPCNLYQSAQHQIKRAEEVKKVKEIKKEEAEDWQNNLDNWKSSRRKRVEHIIDRVVEVKKLELEEHERQRRKSKTFSEMLEERGERKGRSNKLASLTVYTEDEANDLSDLGIGTSSASGKSSLSEDYDNHSVMSDNVDTEKQNFGDIDNNSNNDSELCETTRDYISSPGYDTSSSTAPASSPDPCEYTYEGAIQDYKTRVSRATTTTTTPSSSLTTNYNNGFRSNLSSPYSKDSTPERITNDNNLLINNQQQQQYLPRRMSSGNKIEERLINFEIKNDITNNCNDLVSITKKDLPKVDILKRRELFEKDKINNCNNNQKRFSGDFSNTKSIRERLTSLEKKIDDLPSSSAAMMSSNSSSSNKNINRNNDITSIKDRLQNLEIKQNESNDLSTISINQINDLTGTTTIGKPSVTVTIKDRLSSLQNAVTKEEIKKPIMLIDEHQLEILKKEDYNNKQAAAVAAAAAAQMAESLKVIENVNLNDHQELLNIQDESNIDTDREDSGIHTTDVSCSVSQTDEQPELVNDENHDHHHHHINNIDDDLCNNKIATTNNNMQIDDIKLNVVNDVVNELKEPAIETNSNYHESTEELSISSTVMSPNDDLADLESSVNEAIELALNAIDQEDISCDETINLHNNKLNEMNDDEINHQIDIIHQQNHQINQKSEPIYENIDETLIGDDIKLKIDEDPLINCQQLDNTIIESIIIDEITTPNISQFIESETIKSIGSSPPTAQVRKSLVNLQQQQYQHKNQSNFIQTNNENIDCTNNINVNDEEPYYQVPKSSEPYYEVPKSNQRIPLYENIELFYNGNLDGSLTSVINTSIPPMVLQPPKEKPPPPPIDIDNDDDDDDNEQFIGENTYEIISNKKSIKNNIICEQNHLDESRNCIDNKPIKRMNSTKRIKKEIRNKRSSFLGIEGTNDDDSFLEFSVAPPPDMIKLLQEERRLEKQLYMKAGLYDSSDTGESRDSGVSENHSRQSSEPFTNSSEEHVDLLKKKEKEIIEVLEKEEEKQKQQQSDDMNHHNWEIQQQHQTITNNNNNSDVKMQCIEEQIREQEEVLRVERELLQLEQEELKRQRENLMLRENLARRELEHGAKMLMSANRRSLQDINATISTNVQTMPVPVPKQLTTAHQHKQQQQQPAAMINHYANVPNQIYQVQTDYRKSLSDLQDFSPTKRLSAAPAPPAKPLRSHMSLDNGNRSINYNASVPGGGLVKIANQSIISPITSPIHSIHHSQSIDEYVPLRNYQTNTALYNSGNMSRNTLLALSATPKPKFTDAWIQQSTKKTPITAAEKAHETWLYQQKRKSVPEGFNYNKHWLIQEAEQRRIDQQRGLIRTNGSGGGNSSSSSSSSGGGGLGNGGWTGTSSNLIQKNSNNKPLPDAVIQTITQRVQSKGIGERKRIEARSTDSLISPFSQSNPILNSTLSTEDVYHQEKILSISGKKKCSHCGDELGRGAAMIIESLRLFYHINCFKCCVCHVQLGDGLNGTDVRVRNHKLHCHNCYSSDDGIKFSCV